MPDPTAHFEALGLRVRVRTADDIVVVAADGEIDVATAPLVAMVFEAACLAGCRRVVLDASGVTFMGAAGLGPLVDVERRHGVGSALVRNPATPVLRLLQLVDRCDLVEYRDPSTEIRRLRAADAVDVPLVPASD